jgi:predicted permease
LNFDLWLPATMAPTVLAGSPELQDRSLRGYTVMGAAAARSGREQMRADVDRVMRDLARAYPDTNANIRGEVLPYWQAPRGPQRLLAAGLAVLQAILLILLLAVCGNTVNLMLARATTRQREIGVRLALGATRGDVLRLLLTENLLLSLGGAVAGILIAAWATEALRAVPMIGAFPIRLQTRIDALAIAFAAALGAVCGLLIGFMPALHLARLHPHRALHAEGAIAGRGGIRRMLMAVEVGLATVVLIAAAMFLRSFSDSRDTDPGFKREGVLLAAYDLTGRGMDDRAARQFAVRLLDRVRALPGVQSAAIAASVPLDIHGLPMRGFVIEGRARADGRADVALSNIVTPGYFTTMGIGFVAGSDLAALDDPAPVQQVVVNQAFVDRFLGDAEPLGRRIFMRGTGYAIVGVVRTTLSDSFSEGATPVIYLSYRDRPAARGEIHVRTRAGSEALLGPSLERAIRDVDANAPLYDIRTLTEHVDKNLFLRRIPARMFVVLGPLLLALAAIGIYAVVAYAVSRRTREIGVRLALGATRRGIVAAIVLDTMRAVTAGASIGWFLAYGVNIHLVRGPAYLSVFGAVPALLLTVAAAAAYVPAKRAAQVDPAVALRVD